MQKKEKKKLMAPVRFTEMQMNWIKDESERTGETMASVVRSLVQKQAVKAARS